MKKKIGILLIVFMISLFTSKPARADIQIQNMPPWILVIVCHVILESSFEVLKYLWADDPKDIHL